MATTHFADYELMASVFQNLDPAMNGMDISTLQGCEQLAEGMVIEKID
ncbi:hypothetical protein [Brevibacillus marinus]|nr:hypothetical protein [Brevibacillus marinus]